MVKDYWTAMGTRGFWNVDLCHGLNDWEVDDLAHLLGNVDLFVGRSGRPIEMDICKQWDILYQIF